MEHAVSIVRSPIMDSFWNLTAGTRRCRLRDPIEILRSRMNRAHAFAGSRKAGKTLAPFRETLSMKTIIVLGDGMSDYPVESLGGRTPLQAAKKPSIDRIAREGRMGLFETIPAGLSKGSAVANLSVLGYDPAETYNGRAVLEAANMGVALDECDVAFRMNLCCLENGRIKNHSAGHISTEEARMIIDTLQAEMGEEAGEIPVDIHAGVSYRHLLVLRGPVASPKIRCAPPHDHVGSRAEDLLPAAECGEAKATEKKINQMIRIGDRGIRRGHHA